jgi:hypothetical protein
MAVSVLRAKFEMEPEIIGDLGARIEDVAQEAIDAVAATYASDADIDVDQHLRAQWSGRGIRAANEEWISEIAQAIRSGHQVRMGQLMAVDGVERFAHVWIVEELPLTRRSDNQIEQCDRVGAVH